MIYPTTSSREPQDIATIRTKKVTKLATDYPYLFRLDFVTFQQMHSHLKDASYRYNLLGAHDRVTKVLGNVTGPMTSNPSKKELAEFIISAGSLLKSAKDEAYKDWEKYFAELEISVLRHVMPNTP